MRYKWFSRAIAIRVVALVLVFLVGYSAGRHKIAVVRAEGPFTVPKSWGRCVGGMMGGLVFEDSSGVIRIVDMHNGEMEIQINRN